METWLTYELQDFLLFSNETYLRLFERVNGGSWYTPAVATVIAVTIAISALIGRPRFARLTGGFILAAAWIWCGIVFVRGLYAPINPLADWLWPLWLVQSALIIWVVLQAPARDGKAVNRDGGGLLLLGAVIWIAVTAASRPPGQIEAFGLAPDPTITFTLGWLFAYRGWLPLFASVLPLCFLIIGTLTLFALELPTAYVATISLLFFLIGVARRFIGPHAQQ